MTVTDKQLRQLRAEAYNAGDHAMGDIADIALGNNDPAARWSTEDARAECERVILGAGDAP